VLLSREIRSVLTDMPGAPTEDIRVPGAPTEGLWTPQPQVQHEGNGFYSPCACWSQAPYSAEWYGILTVGCYWRSAPWGTHLVMSRMYQTYMWLQAECGAYGLPITDAADLSGPPWNLPGWSVQYFYNPAKVCGLNYIYQCPPGTGDSPNWTINGIIPNYYC
jgi:hypothetical protein